MFGLVRNGLMAVQAAHLSRWLETSDVLVGVLGMWTSFMDLVPVWPERKLAVQPSIVEKEVAGKLGGPRKRDVSVDSMGSTEGPESDAASN